MSRVLIIQNSCLWPKRSFSGQKAQKKALVGDVVFRQKSELHGKAGIGLVTAVFLAIAGILAAGIFYLYQVNSIATKGYELRELEGKVQESEKDINKLKIREVELKSMYNIEKATEDLNLVTSLNITYLDAKRPVAMK
ncbi:MAG: hypothetical protein AAB487_01960 [Patescibacteria group bacterium]